MTREQYDLGMKLAQTLRDIHPIQFFMPSWFRSIELMLDYLEEGEREQTIKEIGEAATCGTAYCVGGWLAALCGETKMLYEKEGGSINLWVAQKLGIDETHAIMLCSTGLDKTKEQKAQQLEDFLNLTWKERGEF